jgi:hypothetical protein
MAAFVVMWLVSVSKKDTPDAEGTARALLRSV